MSNPFAGLSEYDLRHWPAHRLKARRWARLETLLTDLDFEQTRLGALPDSEPAAVTMYDVLRDFSDALAAMPAEAAGRPRVEVLYRVLDQQAYLLREHPRWFVQQLANACDWDRTVLGDEIRRAEARCPWPRLRLLSRPALSTILSLKRVLAGHTYLVFCVVWSPDGNILASGSGDRTVRLWDASTGEQRLCLRGHDDFVYAVSFALDGRTLASGSRDKTVRLWDASTGEQRICLRGHDHFVNAVSFAPDGRTLASASSDHTVRLWDASTGEQRLCLQGHDHLVEDVSFSPDGRTLASASADKTVRLWDASTGQQRLCLQGHDHTVNAVSFSPDGRTLASASADKTVRLWDASAGKQRLCLQGHDHFVDDVSFSPDGRTLASASHDMTVRLWDIATGKQCLCLQEHRYAVRAVSFAPDGHTLATVSHWEQAVRLWDASRGEQRVYPQGHGEKVTAVSFAPDGRTVATASYDDTVRLWDASTGEQRLCVQGHGGEVVSFSPDGRTLANGSFGDKPCCLWDTSTGKRRLCLQGDKHVVQAMSFAPDGRTLASANFDGLVQLWDTTTGEQHLRLQGHREKVSALSFAPNGRSLASGSNDKTVRLWDVATGKQCLCLQEHQHDVIAVQFSPDGTTLATVSSWDNTVRLWDASTGEQRRCFRGHGGNVISFSPDGHTLASASGGTVCLWETNTGSLITCFPECADEIRALWFDPKVPRLLAVAAGDVVRAPLVYRLDLIHIVPGDAWQIRNSAGQSTMSHDEPIASLANAALDLEAPQHSLARFAKGQQRMNNPYAGLSDYDLRHWPAHSLKARRWATLESLLTDLEFLQARLGCVGGVVEPLPAANIFQVLEDYIDALGTAKSPHAWREVDELYRVLDSDSHVFQLERGILLQQVYNALAERFGPSTDLGTALRQVSSVAFAPDGHTLASGSIDRTVRLWHVVGRGETAFVAGHLAGLLSASFAPDGRTLAGSDNTTVRLWDLASREETARLLLGGVRAVAFAPDGRKLAGTVVYRTRGVSNDEKKTENMLWLWDVGSGRDATALAGIHQDYVNCVAFARHGQMLASGSEDKTVRLWDLASRQQFAWLPMDDRALALWFSADDTHLRVADGGRGFGRPTIRILQIVNGYSKAARQ